MGVKYRFPDWREDLAERERFCKADTFSWKYANQLSGFKGSTVLRTSHYSLKSHKFVLWCKFGQKVGQRQRKGLMSSRTESQPTGSCSRKTEKQKSKQATTAAVFRNCEYFCERLSGHSNFNHQSDTDVKSRWA